MGYFTLKFISAVLQKQGHFLLEAQSWELIAMLINSVSGHDWSPALPIDGFPLVITAHLGRKYDGPILPARTLWLRKGSPHPKLGNWMLMKLDFNPLNTLRLPSSPPLGN